MGETAVLVERLVGLDELSLSVCVCVCRSQRGEVSHYGIAVSKPVNLFVDKKLWVLHLVSVCKFGVILSCP